MVSEEAEAVPGDVLGIVLSVCLIGVCGLLALLVSKAGRQGGCTASCGCSNTDGRASIYPEVARKIVHIGVSNWFFIYYFVFEGSFWAIVGLCAFAVVNALLNVSGAMGVLFSQSSKKRNWGMVYYPLSVVLLILLAQSGFGDRLCVGCSLIGMGYGDGLAAIIGMRFGRHSIYPLHPSCSDGRPGSPVCQGGSEPKGRSGKTIEGSAVMFAVVLCSFVLLNVLLGGVGIPRALGFGVIAAAASTVAEAYTPLGLDNVTVPLCIYIAAVMCGM